MPKFQDKIGGNRFDQYGVPDQRLKDALAAEVVTIDAALTVPETTIDQILSIAAERSATTGAAVLSELQDRRNKRQQQIRLWELSTQQIIFEEPIATLLRFDPALGGAVQSVCGEEVGNEAVGVLTDGGKWNHLLDEPHSIVLDLGNPEVFDAVGVSIDAGVNTSHLLRGVDVFASIGLSGIDDPANQILTAVDFATLDSDNLTVLASNKKARYVKLTNITTDNPQNSLRVKCIKVRVVPKFFGEE